MELIEDLGMKEAGDGRTYRYGLFRCPVCGQGVIKIKKDGINAKYCSHECYATQRERRGPYKRKIISKKYAYIYRPDHPHAIGTKKLYVAEHRLVMEEYLGRYLDENEVVHHINEDTLDNRIENLQLMTASEHIKLHKANIKRQKDGKFKT